MNNISLQQASWLQAISNSLTKHADRQAASEITGPEFALRLFSQFQQKETRLCPYCGSYF